VVEFEIEGVAPALCFHRILQTARQRTRRTCPRICSVIAREVHVRSSSGTVTQESSSFSEPTSSN
jgi:hypothetical protein